QTLACSSFSVLPQLDDTAGQHRGLAFDALSGEMDPGSLPPEMRYDGLARKDDTHEPCAILSDGRDVAVEHRFHCGCARDTEGAQAVENRSIGARRRRDRRV